MASCHPMIQQHRKWLLLLVWKIREARSITKGLQLREIESLLELQQDSRSPLGQGLER